MNLSSIGITTPVYINNILCSYYKMLWRKCKKLQSGKFIHAFRLSNGSINLKIAANDNDLEELFLGYKLLLESESNDQLQCSCNSAIFCYYVYIYIICYIYYIYYIHIIYIYMYIYTYIINIVSLICEILHSLCVT